MGVSNPKNVLTEPLRVNIDKPLKQWLVKRAAREQRSEAAVVRIALRAYRDKIEGES